MTTLAFGENKRLKRFVYHAIAWAVYTGFVYGANYISNPSVQVLPTVFFLLPFCITFYVSLYFLHLFKEKGIWWRIATFFLVFLVMACFGYFYVYFLLPQAGVYLYGSNKFNDFLKSAVLGFVQYFTYALLYFYTSELFRKERRLRKLEEEKLLKELENSRLKEQELQMQKDKLSLEYAFLRAQVNPHFLHNTLNVLFSQAMDHSQELADNIAKLSRIMRYSLESVEFETDRVPVEKELEHLALLIAINDMRFEGSKLISYEVNGTAQEQMVPPLAFITVVENAFKYGDLKDASNPLHIVVTFMPGQVAFVCRNKKRKNSFQLSSHSIGITNLGKRLDVSFANRYQMDVKEDDLFYEFSLTLQS